MFLGPETGLRALTPHPYVSVWAQRRKRDPRLTLSSGARAPGPGSPASALPGHRVAHSGGEARGAALGPRALMPGDSDRF